MRVFVFLCLLAAGPARAEIGVCAVLLRTHPTPEQVQGALAAGDDPNRRCSWQETRRMIDTLGGFLAAAIIPVPFLPIGLATDVQVKRRSTPLALAIGHGDPRLVRVLLDGGARPDGVDSAVSADRYDIAAMLVEAGADPYLGYLATPLAGDTTRLARAREAGLRLDRVSTVDGAERILRDDAVLEAFLAAGLPPGPLVEAAVASGRADAVARLVAASPPDACTAHEALALAVSTGRLAVEERLRSLGTPWEPPPACPVEPALHRLVDGGADRQVERLLAAGAKVDVRDNVERTPLLRAVDAGRASTARLLLAAGADPNSADVFGHRPLSVAAEANALPLVDLLLDAGALPDAPVLREAAESGSVAALDRLIAAGADVGATGGGGRTLTHAALGTTHLARVLEAGAPLNLPDERGRTPLFAAVVNEDAAAVQLLLARGAAAATTDATGLTPLHVAAWSGRLLDPLIRAGADLEARNAEGRTPLMETFSPATVQVLVAAGARAEVRDVHGNSALRVAVAADQRELARVLVAGDAVRDAAVLGEALRTCDAAWLAELAGGATLEKAERRDLARQARREGCAREVRAVIRAR